MAQLKLSKIAQFFRNVPVICEDETTNRQVWQILLGFLKVPCSFLG